MSSRSRLAGRPARAAPGQANEARPSVDIAEFGGKRRAKLTLTTGLPRFDTFLKLAHLLWTREDYDRARGRRRRSIGNGVTGTHNVALRLDSGPKNYAFFIGGDRVSPAALPTPARC